MKKKLRAVEMILCVFIVVMGCLVANRNDAVVVNSSMKNLVVIDPGHGIPDGGAVGESGVLESEINLMVAETVRNELQKAGVGVIMTRSDENAIYPDENATVREKKRADLRERVRIINESGADLAVSIHMNYFGIEKYSGPQLFCRDKNEMSKKAAIHIKNSIIENIGEHCNREIKEVTGGIYVLEHSDVPIVLAECGFLSNKEEEKLLINPDYCEKMGTAIAKGIILYLTESKS